MSANKVEVTIKSKHATTRRVCSPIPPDNCSYSESVGHAIGFALVDHDSPQKYRTIAAALEIISMYGDSAMSPCEAELDKLVETARRILEAYGKKEKSLSQPYGQERPQADPQGIA